MNDENEAVSVLLWLVLFLLVAWIVSIHKRMKEREAREREEQERKEIEERRHVSKSLRAFVMERDDATCQICGISRKMLDDCMDGLGDYLLLEIDHVTSVAAGGRGDDAENLQVLCWRCNRKKSGDKTNSEVAAEIDYGAKYLQKKKKKWWW
ncbi:MAG: HNH endonuclease [Oscillospiraceae bacterium]|nr:HNH endonuclease [Oscillospiraceae bacterium]